MTPDKNVTAVTSDDLGLLWIATSNGLYRFDGNNYVPIDETGNAMLFSGGNAVSEMRFHGAGHLFIYSAKGIYEYDTLSQSLKQVAVLPGIDAVADSPDSNVIYVNTSRGIYSFLPRIHTLRLILEYKNDASDRRNSSKQIGVDREGNIWTVKDHRLLRLKPDAGSPNLSFITDTLSTLRDNYNVHISRTGDMFLYNSDNYLLGRYSIGEKNKFNVEFQEITALTEQEDGTVVIGIRGLGYRTIRRSSRGGYDTQDHILESFQTQGHQRINALHADRRGNLWAGTRTGLSRLSSTAYERLITEIGEGPDTDLHLSSSVVHDILPRKDEVWVATTEGLDRITFHPASRTPRSITSYRVPDTVIPGIRRNNLRRLASLDENHILVGTEEGLATFNTKDTVFSSPGIMDETNISQEKLVSTAYREGEIWLGTENGLFRVETRTRRATKISPDSSNGSVPRSCHAIAPDAMGSVWAAWDDGRIVRLQPEDATGRQQWFGLTDRNGSPCYASSLFADPMNNIWAGSSMGLFHYSQQSGAFIPVDLPLPPSSRFINDIVNDNNGNLWLMTAEGVCRYNPHDGSAQFIILQEGRLSDPNVLSAISAFRGNDILLSGINGLTCFNSSGILADQTRTNCLFSEFRVNNRELRVGDGILKEDINRTDAIQLSRTDHVSFSFSSLSAERPGIIRYSHKMDGVDDDWIDDGSASGTISYSKLPIGHHILRIRCTNPLGIWQVEKAIDIHVRPPSWLSPASIIFYLLLLFTLATAITAISRRRSSAKTKKALIESRAQLYEELARTLRDPLTIMQSSIHSLTSEEKIRSDEKSRYLVETIRTGGKRLSLLIDQLEQFAELSQDKNALHFRDADFIKFYYDVMESFKPLLLSKRVTLACTSGEDAAWVRFDREKMESVFFGAMSFLYKYAVPGSTIRSSCKKDDDMLSLRIFSDHSSATDSDLQNVFEHIPEGNDLGLAMVLASNIAHLHGGTMAVSKDDDSVSLRIRLPLSEEGGYGAEGYFIPHGDGLTRHIEALNVRESAFEGPAGSSYSILFVSKDETLCHYIENAFKGLITVHSFHNPKGLEAVIRKKKPDAIVCEALFEGKEKGLEFCQQLKTSPQTSNIPFIAISTKKDSEMVRTCYRYGADTFIPKPFDVEFLSARITQLIQNREDLQTSLRQKMIATPKDMKVQSQSDKLLQKAMTVMESNMDNEAFKVEDFAFEMNMSPSMLYRKIKALTGSSPADFIRAVRMKRAAQLLLSDAYNITEIASMVGFQDMHYFSTCFKREFDQTPTQYKKNNR